MGKVDRGGGNVEFPAWIAWTSVTTLALAGFVMFAMWPRNDAPQSPDAVVVLGGAGTDRAQLGIALSHEHDAVLVLSSSARVFAEDLGVKCGGPRVVCVEPDPENTMGEAQTVARLAHDHGWSHVTVATSAFHTTRARVLFRQCLGDHVSVVGARRADGARVGLARWANEVLGTVGAVTFRRAC